MDIGVVIGRFQVEALHEGHRFLINTAFQNHRRVIIFIGCSPIEGTKHDPLDFQTRLRMVQSEYPDAIVLPLHDQQNDEAWSQKLDQAIRGVVPNVTKACLYGGRDSFHPSYKGQFTPVKIDSTVSYRNGTSQREDIGKVVRNTADFRAGIIYSTQNSWAYVKACVDIAVVRKIENLSGHYVTSQVGDFEILLGRKPNEVKWRLPGGMLERGETFESVAAKELKEETGIIVKKESLEYLQSNPVGDWRMKNAGEVGLVTVLFGIVVPDGTAAEAGSDLAEVKWFPFDDAVRETMNGHRPLVLTAEKKYTR